MVRQFAPYVVSNPLRFDGNGMWVANRKRLGKVSNPLRFDGNKADVRLGYIRGKAFPIHFGLMGTRAKTDSFTSSGWVSNPLRFDGN